jgi:hypothetical protein
MPFAGVLGNHEGYDAVTEDKEVLNHENIGELFEKYYPYFYPNPNRFYRSFDYGPVHFVILDTWSYATSSESKQSIDTVQANWLKQNLRASTKPWKIVVLHTPIWECIQGFADLQNTITPILKAGGVHLVIQGHHHYYSRAETDGPYPGITYVTVGGGGAKLDAPAPCVQETNKVWPTIGIFGAFHFARFDISGDTLNATVIDSSTGLPIDSFTITNQNTGSRK